MATAGGTAIIRTSQTGDMWFANYRDLKTAIRSHYLNPTGTPAPMPGQSMPAWPTLAARLHQPTGLHDAPGSAAHPAAFIGTSATWAVLIRINPALEMSGPLRWINQSVTPMAVTRSCERGNCFCPQPAQGHPTTAFFTIDRYRDASPRRPRTARRAVPSPPPTSCLKCAVSKNSTQYLLPRAL